MVALSDGAGGRLGGAAAPCFVETPLTAKLLADPAMREEIVARASGAAGHAGRGGGRNPVSGLGRRLGGCCHLFVINGGWLAQ